MISELRTHLENNLNIPVHFVHIIEGEQLPCATIRQTQLESHQALSKPNGFRVTGVDVTLWHLSYPDLQDTTEALLSAYDGAFLQLGGNACRFVLEDVEDDSYVNPDGSDNWIYTKQITFHVHYKTAAGITETGGISTLRYLPLGGNEGEVVKIVSGSPAWSEDLDGGGGSDFTTLAELNAIVTDATLVDAVHQHTKSDITDFSDLDYATAAQGTLADTALQALPVHQHTKSDITDFSELDYATAAQGTLADTALQSIPVNLTWDAAGFVGNLDATDNTLQEVFNKLDSLSAGGGETSQTFDFTGLATYHPQGPQGQVTIPAGTIGDATVTVNIGDGTPTAAPYRVRLVRPDGTLAIEWFEDFARLTGSHTFATEPLQTGVYQITTWNGGSTFQTMTAQLVVSEPDELTLDYVWTGNHSFDSGTITIGSDDPLEDLVISNSGSSSGKQDYSILAPGYKLMCEAAGYGVWGRFGIYGNGGFTVGATGSGLISLGNNSSVTRMQNSSESGNFFQQTSNTYETSFIAKGCYGFGTKPNGSNIYLYPGYTTATNGDSGKCVVRLSSGTGTGADGKFLVEESTGVERFSVDTAGNVFMHNLPIADPVVAGQVWNDAGTLKISAG